MECLVISMKKYISKILILIVILSTIVLMGVRNSFSNTVNFGIYVAQIVLLTVSLLLIIEKKK